MERKLSPCPICGKRPKVSFNISYEMTSYRCTIRCAPFLRKEHMSVEEIWFSSEDAKGIAINEWNKKVKSYKERDAR